MFYYLVQVIKQGERKIRATSIWYSSLRRGEWRLFSCWLFEPESWNFFHTSLSQSFILIAFKTTRFIRINSIFMVFTRALENKPSQRFGSSYKTVGLLKNIAIKIRSTRSSRFQTFDQFLFELKLREPFCHVSLRV